MRRSAITVSAAALTAALLLAGCSSPDEDGAAEEPTQTTTTDPGQEAELPPGNSPEDLAALETVTVDGETGSAPTLGFEAPLAVTGPAAVLVSPGDGTPITEENLLIVNFVQVDGTDGTEVYSTYGQTPEVMRVGDFVPEVNELLVGQNAGTRVLFAAPGEENAVLMALEVTESREPRADGSPVAAPDGVPAVTLADNGEPSIEPVDAEAPGELVVAPLLEGEGKTVEEGDHLIVQYSGWLWDGTPFDSSWSRSAPFPLQAGAGEVIEGWDTGLLGQTVGSQVLLVIPPELGYGDTDNASIPANSTLVFVVDILFAG